MWHVNNRVDPTYEIEQFYSNMNQVYGTSLVSPETARVNFVSVSEQAIERCLVMSNKSEM